MNWRNRRKRHTLLVAAEQTKACRNLAPKPDQLPVHIGLLLVQTEDQLLFQFLVVRQLSFTRYHCRGVVIKNRGIGSRLCKKLILRISLLSFTEAAWLANRNLFSCLVFQRCWGSILGYVGSVAISPLGFKGAHRRRLGCRQHGPRDQSLLSDVSLIREPFCERDGLIVSGILHNNILQRSLHSFLLGLQQNNASQIRRDCWIGYKCLISCGSLCS